MNALNYTAMNLVCHYPWPAKFWILDIDGTLMPSQQVDNECYWQAVFEYFGEQPRTLDLHQFEHVTDGSILDEWMQRTRGRPATAVESKAIRKRFLELVRHAREKQPHAFEASPGLVEWLEQQLGHHGPCVAIATGGWGHTARFKLDAAGLHAFDLPLASSDDGETRCAIMQHAHALLLRGRKPAAGPGQLPATCYIGDGVWDFRATQELGWEFIGIAGKEQARALRKAGAGQVYCNFAGLAASKNLSAAKIFPPHNALTS